MYLIIIILPFISCLVSGLFGRFIGIKGIKILPFFILLNLFFSLFLMADIIINNSVIVINSFNWFNLGLVNNHISFRFDLIVGSMLILINLVSFCVHLFSYSYMNEDPHILRFFSYLSLFTFFMVILVSSSNLVQLFIGWEGVGLCSYLLINFWFTRIQANKSAIKAIVINKIGDIGLLLGILIIFLNSGSFSYNEIFSYYSSQFEDPSLSLPLFLIVIGIIGKSAQIGLHMWLPDAMEGPTPVSALIHAATMVTAGVFLIIRISPLFELVPEILIFIILIGSITSFFSAIIGLSQNDLKKVIAYSTCSQLGYMVTICGFSYYDLGLFHLINHGFFKALLFLSSGSVIHAILDEQDIRRLGGLGAILPLSSILIIIGSLSLMGLPFLTGFYSKDLIIELLRDSNKLYFAFFLGILSAFLTAFYSFRLIFFTFLNYPQTSVLKLRLSHEGDLVLIFPLIILGILSIVFGFSFKYIILGDYLPVFVSNLDKISPLVLSITGLSLSLIMGLNIINFWYSRRNPILNFFYYLSINLWYFDYLISYYLLRPVLTTGYSITYKFIDNQIIEKFGPNFMYKFFSNSSNLISKYHSGRLSSYMFFLIIFSVLIIIYTTFFWLWRSKN